MKCIIFLLFIAISCLCAQRAQAITTDEEAPNFTLNSLYDNQPISLVQFRGKVVYLDFWASWCVPCRQSFPFLNHLRQQYQQDGFKILSINLDENPQLATDFLEKFPVNFNHLKGFGTEVSEQYAIEGLPSAFFIDVDGRIRLIHKGFKPNHREFLKAVLEKLLAEK